MEVEIQIFSDRLKNDKYWNSRPWNTFDEDNIAHPFPLFLWKRWLFCLTRLLKKEK